MHEHAHADVHPAVQIQRLPHPHQHQHRIGSPTAFRWSVILNSGLSALQLVIGVGFGSLALGDIIGAGSAQAAVDSRDPFGVRKPHFEAKAKRVIHFFMNGGPSQVDTFDFKPADTFTFKPLYQHPVVGRYCVASPVNKTIKAS